MLQTLIRPDRINIHKTSTTPIFRFPLDLLPEPLFGIIQVTARLTHPSGVKQSRVVLRGLSHNRCRTLAGILALAFVFGELDPETLLRVGNPLHGTQGHFELAIAKSTDSDSGNGAHPFDHPKIVFWHGCVFSSGGLAESSPIGFSFGCLLSSECAPLASEPPGLRESEAVPVSSHALLIVAGRSPVWIRLAFA
jgi:hypothetical protein